jgi:predicted RND superfamily exporter protein
MVFVVGWQGLYMSALGIKISPLGASLGALTVGIGAEYTIIVMERYFEEKSDGASPIEAIEIASQRVGKAITVSGMTTVFGFSALTLSPFPIVSDFGFLTVGVIFLTLVGALVIMPPTLVVLDQLATDIKARRSHTVSE